MSLGERIKEQRKSSGLSQEKVAEFVGVSRQAVTKWETGQSAPSTENLFKLAEIFGTTVDILLASDEEEKDTPAEQIYYLYKMEQEKKREERRKKEYIFYTGCCRWVCHCLSCWTHFRYNWAANKCNRVAIWR